MTSQFFCKSHVAYFHFKIYLILPLIEIHVNMKVSLHFLLSRAPLISFKVFHLSSSYWSSLPFFPCNLHHISYLSLGELCLLLVEHLFLKEQAPKESSAAKLKIGPIIKLCFFSSFEKLVSQASGRLETKVLLLWIQQQTRCGVRIIYAFLLKADLIPYGYVQ